MLSMFRCETDEKMIGSLSYCVSCQKCFYLFQTLESECTWSSHGEIVECIFSAQTSPSCWIGCKHALAGNRPVWYFRQIFTLAALSLQSHEHNLYTGAVSTVSMHIRHNTRFPVWKIKWSFKTDIKEVHYECILINHLYTDLHRPLYIVYFWHTCWQSVFRLCKQPGQECLTSHIPISPTFWKKCSIAIKCSLSLNTPGVMPLNSFVVMKLFCHSSHTITYLSSLFLLF